MRSWTTSAAALCLAMMAATASGATAQHAERVNPMISLHEHDQPVFGLYAPRARMGRGADAVVRPPAELAAETMGFRKSDFVFDGSMEGGVEDGLPAFTAFVEAMRAAGATTSSHPLVVKMEPIGTEYAGARRAIARQLDAGASTVMLVEVESAEEVRQAISAMRFAEDGGMRPDRVGAAPDYWGLSEAEYRRRADVWPLDPEGELILWVIVESRAGLANLREIAAVPGIGVLWPGAGTLRRVFSETDAAGERVLDEEAWEAAIQSVLTACKDFEIACGYPANANDIAMRMAQGFSVFVMGWGEGGFETVELGRELAGR